MSSPPPQSPKERLNVSALLRLERRMEESGGWRRRIGRVRGMEEPEGWRVRRMEDSGGWRRTDDEGVRRIGIMMIVEIRSLEK